jgi:threonine dehydrogenase-like Zn-dependent dehydrogenase
MRSLVLTGERSLKVVEVPRPTAGDAEVELDVIATGVCGSDVHGYTGVNGRRFPGQVMGHETVGVVTSSGSAHPVGTIVVVNPIVSCGVCTACDAGERQVCAELRVIGVDPALPGSFADTIVVPSRNVNPLASGVPAVLGALVEPLAVGFHALMRSAPKPDDRLLVVGGGPIGQAAAIAGQRAGVKVILVSEPVEARRKVLASLGICAVPPEDLSLSVKSVLDGAATVVVDAVGTGASIESSLNHSTSRARIVLVGMGAPEVSLRAYGISVAERTVVGSYCYSDDHFAQTAQWIGETSIDLSQLIGEACDLAAAPDAFRRAAAGTAPNKTLLLGRAARTAG